jgi:3,4-dihydroxy 2-butanone 4-phosphate synthase/GTP cyclohydrolase II
MQFSCRNKKPHVHIVADAKLPTRFGTFKIFTFCNTIDGKEHVAIVKGDISGKSAVPLRLHSECLTGDAIGSLRCDCRSQLEWALSYIESRGTGAVLYVRQEGRGIGLINKIRAYSLQDKGLDTVQANIKLGFPSDLRDYRLAAKMIKLLGPASINLITNNPKKIAALRKYGIKVLSRIPLHTKPTQYNKSYLEAKRRKMGHMI